MPLVAVPHDSGAQHVTFTGVMDHVAQGFEAVGVLVLVIGIVWSIWLGAAAWRRFHQPTSGYKALKQAFGNALLLSVEIFVAADLVRTVVVSPTLDNVLVLGLLVLIRTFLSFSLETEIEGVLPWRRATARGAGTSRQASAAASGNDAP
jgi:uncharacterized membrane protein